jgi:hypothetical protein
VVADLSVVLPGANRLVYVEQGRKMKEGTALSISIETLGWFLPDEFSTTVEFRLLY